MPLSANEQQHSLILDKKI